MKAYLEVAILDSIDLLVISNVPLKEINQEPHFKQFGRPLAAWC
jgi:hypothetical protein